LQGQYFIFGLPRQQHTTQGLLGPAEHFMLSFINLLPIHTKIYGHHPCIEQHLHAKLQPCSFRGNGCRKIALSSNAHLNKITDNSLHILQQFIPDRITVNYKLRTRSHNKTLIPKMSYLN